MSDTEVSKKIALLKRSQYFKGLSPEILERVSSISVLQSFEKGQVLVRQGTETEAMYILASGSVDVFTEDSLTGATRPIRSLSRGDCFGEISFLVGKPRTASVKAREVSVALMMKGRDFQILMQRAAPVAVGVCRVLAAWLYTTRTQNTYRFVKLKGYPIQKEIVSRFTEKKIKHYKALPLYSDGSKVVVAMTDPSNLLTVDDLRREFSGSPIEVVAVTESDLEDFMTTTYLEL
jgi:CRP-like cAMP-binding protein